MGSIEPPRDYWVQQWKYTPTVHRDVYPAIDPRSNPALSQAGKIVVITGASSGIGAEGLAPAFAHSGASAIVLAARRLDNLRAVEARIAAINPAIKTLCVATDVTDPHSVAHLFQSVRDAFDGRSADVLVSNAGALRGLSSIRDADPDVWRREVDVNLHGPFLLVREFLRGLPANPTTHRPSFVAISSSASVEVIPGLSNYCLAKGALNRLVEFVAAENPRVSAVAMHPGIITTAMSIKEFEPFEGDSMELVGGMAVWLAGDHARWLTGRYVGVNWDVDELLASKDKVLQRDELKVALKGTFGDEVGTVDTKAYKTQPH
ncbi:hypothetical protein IWX49DRAFT_613115 [Phyllosticta citricarpa]|uniref:Ketoreductase domain-containing protein n=2 Tax=Phyllosticta TaxID=121621 RepID=A0ABR1M1Y5_9PEZI